MKTAEQNSSRSSWENTEIAELSDSCMKKLREFERELNKQGYWNITLVAFQIKN